MTHLGIGARGMVALAGAAAMIVASSTACSSAKPAAAVPPPACRQPPPPDLPHAAGQVTETDSGTFCLGVGQRIDGFLSAPHNGDDWGRITSSDTSVLGYGDTSVLTTPLDVTAGIFIAHKAGTAVLSSELPDGKGWTVTVVVR